MQVKINLKLKDSLLLKVFLGGVLLWILTIGALSLSDGFRGVSLRETGWALLYAVVMSWVIFGALTLRDGFNTVVKVATIAEHPVALELVGLLRLRAQKYRAIGNFLIIIICSALLAGAAMFGLAESRPSYAAQSLEYQQIKSEFDLANTRWEGAVKRREKFESENSPNLAAGEKETALNKLIAEELKRKTERDSREQIFAEVLKRGSGSASPNGEVVTIYLTSVLSTKIGTVVLLLVLIQILVSLLRYVLKMAAFHDSRADMMQLASKLGDLELQDIKDLFFSDSIDFAKPTKVLSDLGLDMVRKLVDKSVASSDGRKI